MFSVYLNNKNAPSTSENLLVVVNVCTGDTSGDTFLMSNEGGSLLAKMDPHKILFLYIDY